MTLEDKILEEREIERLIDRALPFLRTLSISPRIRHRMSLRGYIARGGRC